MNELELTKSALSILPEEMQDALDALGKYACGAGFDVLKGREDSVADLLNFASELEKTAKRIKDAAKDAAYEGFAPTFYGFGKPRETVEVLPTIRLDADVPAEAVKIDWKVFCDFHGLTDKAARAKFAEHIIIKKSAAPFRREA